jgi:uncharacterized protein (TIGR02996 family)
MSDRIAFLRAIRANPDDDTSRLVFADWLDEHDDPLGEFVRVQVELEPIRFRVDDPRAVELHAREDELMRKYGDEWVATDHLLTNPADFGPVLRRGLAERACLSLDTFLQNGEALFEAHPTLREVALYGAANRCSELTMSPLLARLDVLEIADWPTDDDALSLSVSPHLDKIARFKLWLGGEPFFLHELVKQAGAHWPHEIELVQVYGGAACNDSETADELNDRADSSAREANARLGRDAVRVTRPFAQLFPLDGDVGKNICAGRLPDGRQALAAGSFENWVVIAFTEDGRVDEIEVRESSVRSPPLNRAEISATIELGTAFVDWVDRELDLELGPIWVREFDVEGLGVELFSYPERERIADPSPHPPPNQSLASWRNDCGRVRGWLEQREFTVLWVHSYRADWRGKIHSS